MTTGMGSLSPAIRAVLPQHRRYVVRHAQCLGNAQDRIVGQREYPLTSQGYAQARQAAELIWRRERVTAVYSSDLLPARETARIIAGLLGLDVVVDADLREQSFGRLEGMRRADMDFSTAERRHLNEVHWGGGESVAEVHARVERFLGSLPEGDGDVVIVSHLHTIQIALSALRGRDHRSIDWVELPSGGIVVAPALSMEAVPKTA
ncbi:histidine phosphatase family protein [Propioniciclava sp.]|uniref:histidine phosphatase family protein n=1 Tax=Propioniciclava sp. TaxID=2038686 RepID=UPI00262A3F5E|nr:histidine phosphatase family protein [Propioniciclava sp.]